jgi:hypothetical protein
MATLKKPFILHIPAQKNPSFDLPPHAVTWEPFPLMAEKILTKDDATIFHYLHRQADQKAKNHRKLIRALRKKYPKEPEILNLAASIYFAHHKPRRANACIKLNYRFNPNYLFAKINYADLCLRRKRAKKVPAIFHHTFNLPDLYPERKVFHVSEFRGFMVVMGFYHLAIKNRDAAMCYHYLAYKVDPSHPSVKILQKHLELI